MLLSIFLVGWMLLSARADNFEIIPKAENETKIEKAVEDVGSKWWRVWEMYNDEATKMDKEVGNQLASGIMTRDTLLDYVVYLVRFLSQLGLFIGWVMIIYAWYLYATSIFGWEDSKSNKVILNAVIGILVIAFSYAIMKLLTSSLIS